MRPLQFVLALLAVSISGGLPLTGLAAEPPALDYQIALYGPAPLHAALYSYSDVFRLTVAGAAMVDFPLAAAGEVTAADSAVRVASAESQASGYVFAIRPVAPHERWMLILCGLAVALWVARRRLSHPI